MKICCARLVNIAISSFIFCSIMGTVLPSTAQDQGNKANDQSLGHRIAEAERKVRTATPEERVRLQREIESLHEALKKLNTSDRPGDWLEFLFSSMEAALPRHELECAAGNGDSYYMLGTTQANTYDVPDAKKTLAPRVR